MGVNKDLAGQKTIQWAINKQQPYLDTIAQLNAAQKAGEATKNEAAKDAMSAISSAGTAFTNYDWGGKKKGGGDNFTGEHKSSYAKVFTDSREHDATKKVGHDGIADSLNPDAGRSDEEIIKMVYDYIKNRPQ